MVGVFSRRFWGEWLGAWGPLAPAEELLEAAVFVGD